MLLTKEISMENKNDSINGAVKTAVIGKSAAKNSVGNTRTLDITTR